MEFSNDLVQFYPNRITVTSRKTRDWQFSLERKAGLHLSLRNLRKSKSSVNLSASSKKEIRDSIFSMYTLSKPRTQKVGNGKFIYNFRQSFVTLTLPSKQVHSDVEIKKCLNHFLTNVRRSFKIQNYVWKAELQQNENIHFHLSFDKYTPFQAIRYYWLLAIAPLGYVDAYQAKFSAMSLSQYAKYRNLSLVDASKPYADGCRSSWRSPNCVDVSAVTTASSVSNYLSKYFAKSEETNLDASRIAQFGKVWARSTSLSRLRYEHKFEWQEVKQFIQQLLEMKAVKRVAYDFSTVFYINFKAFKGIHARWFANRMFNNALTYAYPLPVP